MANLNCIKAVLAEKGIMSKWLAKRSGNGIKVVQQSFTTRFIHIGTNSRSFGCGYTQINLSYKRRIEEWNNLS
jgi:hypothetical protein